MLYFTSNRTFQKFIHADVSSANSERFHSGASLLKIKAKSLLISARLLLLQHTNDPVQLLIIWIKVRVIYHGNGATKPKDMANAKFYLIHFSLLQEWINSTYEPHTLCSGWGSDTFNKIRSESVWKTSVLTTLNLKNSKLALLQKHSLVSIRSHAIFQKCSSPTLIQLPNIIYVSKSNTISQK